MVDAVSSNTAAGKINTGRVLGLHFFMPAHLVPLVEVVLGERSDPVLGTWLHAFMRGCGSVPVLVKIAPDLEDEQIQSIADLLRQHRMDGVIATNTTLSRAEVEGLPNANEAGGLSGAPVFERSTAVLKKLAGHLKGEVPIIGVGGIMQGADAVAKLDAGASLVQLYSGFIYRGPDLVGDVARAIAERRR